MFLRFMHLKINPDYLDFFRPYYDTTILPGLRKTGGCLYAALIQSTRAANELVSMTFWQTQEQAEAFEKSPVFDKFMNQVRNYLSESAEWKLQLSENLELEYAPVREDPAYMKFRMTAQSSESGADALEKESLYVRLVSIRLHPGKISEFRDVYTGEIIPALQNTAGCLYAYLVESLQAANEVISVTIWDKQESAQKYEKSGLFSRLVKKSEHTFSTFYRWKMALERDTGREVKTSDDMKIDSYGLVSGRRLK